MREELSETLSAFVDGEGVDPQALAQALGEPGARELLIDFVLLRSACVSAEQPSPAFYSAVSERLTPRRARRALRLVAAAAVLALAALGLFDLGERLHPGRNPNEPPTPTRVVQFEPGVDWKPIPDGR
jgi:hypothetical protein